MALRRPPLVDANSEAMRPFKRSVSSSFEPLHVARVEQSRKRVGGRVVSWDSDERTAEELPTDLRYDARTFLAGERSDDS